MDPPEDWFHAAKQLRSREYLRECAGRGELSRCGAEMEPIASAVKDLPLRELHLCPECYLVTWTDASGFQVRQGVR